MQQLIKKLINTYKLSDKAVALALSHFFLTSVMIAIIRYLSVDLHPAVIFFFRNMISLPLLLLYIFKSGVPYVKTKRPVLHFFRTLTNFISIGLWFYVVTIMPLAEAVTLNFTAPLFAMCIAMLVLKESINRHRWVAVLVGFLGVIIVLRPGQEVLQAGSLLVLLVSFTMAVSAILLKKLTRTDPPMLNVLYFTIFAFPFSFPFALPYWQMPHGTEWLWLIALSIISLLAQFSISKALQNADLSRLAPYDFSRLVFTTVIAYLAFNETPDFYTIIGAVIIVASSTYSNLYGKKTAVV